VRNLLRKAEISAIPSNRHWTEAVRRARKGDGNAFGPISSWGEAGKDFFIWIRRNRLKKPDSAKGIQGNPSTFPWIYLD
jgi:hypothetical protein